MTLVRRVFLVVSCASLCAASPALGQQGEINGVVTDATASILPGVTVTATETGTGISQATISGDDGRYRFVSLRPTEYELMGELQGFQQFHREGLVLLANQALTVNISLSVGDLTETVTVAGAATQVDISTGTIGEVVDHVRIVELPINGREIAKLQTLVPGTVVESISNDTQKAIPGAVRISANGAGPRQNAYRLDGASNTDPYFQDNQSFPFPEALQEFSIQTSNFSAAEGGSAGAAVNVVTRSGVNAFEGGGFTFVRDSRFNARNFFAAEKDSLERNQTGAYLGGPIKANRTFFFAGWQRTRITNRDSDAIDFVPTAAQRGGDFSRCVPACPQLVDPETGLPFPSNQIPVERFDPASAAVLAALPVPDNAEGQVNTPRRTGQIFQQFVSRVDHQWGPNDQLSARYFVDDFNNESAFDPSNILSYRNPSLEATPRSQSVSASWRRTLSPTLLNELTFGYNRLNTTRRPASDVPAIQDFGVRLPFTAARRSISQIQPVGFFNIGDNLEARFPRDGFRFNNRTSWSHGRHSMQFGAELEYLRADVFNEFRRNGHFVFDGRFTGHALADFLLGRLATFDQGTGEFKNNRIFYQTYFFQDDYRIHDHLTLNLGVRYEPGPPWHDTLGRFEQFTLESYERGVQSERFVNAPPGLLFRGDTDVPEDGTKADNNNLAARTGLAWDVTGDGRTSLRGGFGMFYDTHLRGEFNNEAANFAPWSIRLSVTEPEGPFSDPYRGRDDFDVVGPDVVGRADAPFPRPVGVSTFDELFNTPLTYGYNVAFEREVTPGWMARAAYVGSTATQGRSTRTLNPAIFTPGDDRGTDDRRVLPEFGAIIQFVQDRDSQYHSMQLSLTRRFADGFSLLANYTLADLQGTFVNSGTGDQGGELVPFNHPQFQEIADTLRDGRLETMRRHRFVASWVYDIPGPQRGAAAAILGGWQITGIYEYASGLPLTIISGQDNSRDGIDGDRAIRTGEPFDPPAGSDKTVWFNPAAFAVNPVGTFGETGRGELFGPSFANMDLGLFKRFRFANDMHVQFRAEFFNLFNRANFNNPNANVSGGGFGTITSAQDPRIMQFGLKFDF